MKAGREKESGWWTDRSRQEVAPPLRGRWQPLQHAVEVDQDLGGLEADHSIASALQRGRSAGILDLALAVELPVHLDDELGLGAVEVDHVGLHGGPVAETWAPAGGF